MENPKLQLACVIISILVISILALGVSKLYAMQDVSAGIPSIQAMVNDNSAPSDTSDAPSVLHLPKFNDTNTNIQANGDSTSKDSGSSDANDASDSGSSHDSNSNSKTDHSHNEVNSGDGGNTDHGIHNTHHEHSLQKKAKHKLNVGDIPFP